MRNKICDNFNHLPFTNAAFMTRPLRNRICFLGFVFLAIIIPHALAWKPFRNECYRPRFNGYETPYETLSNARQRDILIADTINDFILYHLETGQYSNPAGWGFPFSPPPHCDCLPQMTNDDSPLQWTPFDRYGNLYSQRARFPQLSTLAWERLEMRGFRVRNLQIFEKGRGMYVKWDIMDPSASRRCDEDRRALQEHFNPRPKRHVQKHEYSEYDFEGEHVCQDPEFICRLQSFFRDPLEFLRNN
jgi:hypothetical protein